MIDGVSNVSEILSPGAVRSRFPIWVDTIWRAGPRDELEMSACLHVRDLQLLRDTVLAIQATVTGS